MNDEMQIKLVTQIRDRRWHLVLNMIKSDPQILSISIDGDSLLVAVIKAIAPDDVIMQILRDSPTSIFVPSAKQEMPIDLAKMFSTRSVYRAIRRLSKKLNQTPLANGMDGPLFQDGTVSHTFSPDDNFSETTATRSLQTFSSFRDSNRSLLSDLDNTVLDEDYFEQRRMKFREDRRRREEKIRKEAEEKLRIRLEEEAERKRILQEEEEEKKRKEMEKLRKSKGVRFSPSVIS